MLLRHRHTWRLTPTYLWYLSKGCVHLRRDRRPIMWICCGFCGMDAEGRSIWAIVVPRNPPRPILRKTKARHLAASSLLASDCNAFRCSFTTFPLCQQVVAVGLVMKEWCRPPYRRRSASVVPVAMMKPKTPRASKSERISVMVGTPFWRSRQRRRSHLYHHRDE
jgi:hypothetical protein